LPLEGRGGTTYPSEINLPRTKQQVKDKCMNLEMIRFHRFSAPKAHMPTKYKVWLFQQNLTKAYYPADPHILTFEPYILGYRKGIPRYTESFRGFGMNKASWFQELDHAGYKYNVLMDYWVVHMNHYINRTKIDSDGARNNPFFGKFRSYLGYRYAKTPWEPLELIEEDKAMEDADRAQSYPETTHGGRVEQQLESKNVSWCVLNSKSTKEGGKFAHFPHALQSLTLCWSWFRTQPPNNIRGLHVGKVGGFGPVDKDWRAAIAFQVMNCTLRYVGGDSNPEDGPFYLPPKKEVNHRRYFWSPDDASSFRDQLFLKEKINATSSGFNIGLVDRKGTRKILNLDQIESAIRRKYPSAVIERVTMEELLEPVNQFRWWARQDVVLTGHGAGVANMVFLKRNAAVIEIYPPHYYNLGFWTLGRAMGVRNYGYFNGHEDPVSDYRQFGRGFQKRIELRGVDLEPPVDEIMKLVNKAVTEQSSGGYVAQVDASQQFPRDPSWT